MLAISFGLLCVYWILRVVICKSSPLFFSLAAISLILFFMLPKQFVPIPTLVIGALLIYSLIRHSKKERSFQLSPMIGWSCLYGVGCLMALLTTVFQFHKDDVIGHVVLKGEEKSVWTTWRNPAQSSTESSWLPSYAVAVQDRKSHELFSDYVIGDYVAVRAQAIIVEWPMKLLGFSHLYRLELVHNGYSTAKRHELFPHVAYPLPYPMQLFEKLWSKLFFNEWQIPGVKSSVLESTFLPLRSTKLTASSEAYDLVVGDTGLSAIRQH